jgi:O-succinylbenzoic acid--CoA ligase
LVINAPKVSDNTIVTNDVVQLISGTEFKWMGRYDNIINSGGIKLNPEQIESKLSEILHQSFFIISLPDSKLGEHVVLILEGVVDKENVMQQIISSKKLNKYELPRSIKTIPEFLRTNSGKVKRTETLALLNL